MAPRASTYGADTQGSASAHGPVHRESSSRGRSATATKPERAASGGPAATRGGSGCSNSGNGYNPVPATPGVELIWHGCDTIGLAWRPSELTWQLLGVAGDTGHLAGFDESTYRTRGHSRVVRTGFSSYMLEKPLLGVRWGWWNSRRSSHRRVVWCEGRLAALQEGCNLLGFSPGNPAALAACAVEATKRWNAMFDPCLLPQEAKVRRVDLAADLQFQDPEDASRFLYGLSVLKVPGLPKTETWRCEGVIETVNHKLRSGKTRWRVYDKTAERASHGSLDGDASAPPQGWIRMERQMQLAKPRQVSPDLLNTQRFAEMWLGELAPWSRLATDVVAGGLPAAQRAVIAAAQRGAITHAQAERLLGHVALTASGLASEFWKGRPHTIRRRDAELHAIGVALDGLEWDTSVCFPLGRILRTVRQAWTQ